jgi:hypothetical protein
MNKYKFFVTISLVFLALFALSNLAIWKLYTEKLIGKGYCERVGGLSRIGYVFDVMECRASFVDLPQKHWELEDFPGGQVDVITLGDSFANGGVKGRNPYFQDYIASRHNLKVLNLNPQLFSIYRGEVSNFLALSAVLLNSGWLEKYKPKYFLIECVERNCIDDFARNINFLKTASFEEIEKFNKINRNDNFGEDRFINNGNFKFLLYNLLYHFDDNAFYSLVYVRKLNQSLFSGPNGNKFLFYHIDIERTRKATDQAIKKLNDNFNTLAEKMAEKNIKLIFMPAVDKFNLYYDNILKNRYAPSVFFEKLRKLPKKYYFVDTKEILLKEIKKGEKDIYYQDDTHWSWKGSQAIINHLKFE